MRRFPSPLSQKWSVFPELVLPMMTLVSTWASRVSPPRSDIQFQESPCSGFTRLKTFTSYPWRRNSSAVSAYSSPLLSVMMADSPRRMMLNRAGRMNPRDLPVPEAPNTAMCRLSRVSAGRHTAFPFRLPKRIPSALVRGCTSSTSFSSLSPIQEAVP